MAIQNPSYKSDIRDIYELFQAAGIPEVLDNNGNPIELYGRPDATGTPAQVEAARENVIPNNVRVDIGDAPNSNTGDPLRTAFIKFNNFMQAVYQADEYKATRFYELERFGRFRGTYTWEQITSPNVGFRPTAAGAFDYDTAINLDYIFIDGNYSVETWTGLDERTIDRTDPKLLFKDGLYTIESNAVLQYRAYDPTPGADNSVPGRVADLQVGESTWVIRDQTTLEDIFLDFTRGVTRLSQGTAESDLTADEQRNLFNTLTRVAAETEQNYRIKAKNMEDALVEIVAKNARTRLDAGYYG